VRIVVAFLVAPMLPALLPAWFASQNGTYHPLAIFVLFCGVFYVLQIVVGAPAYLLLRRLELQQIWLYALIGFASAALPLFVYGKIREPAHDVDRALFLTFYLGFLGGISAAIFWLLARPDRTSQS
jgi:hypothetical protein